MLLTSAVVLWTHAGKRLGYYTEDKFLGSRAEKIEFFIVSLQPEEGRLLAKNQLGVLPTKTAHYH